VVSATAGTRVRLTAVTAARLGDPVVAVVNTRAGKITVEHRRPQNDDAGLSDHTVVMHSIGRRPLPPKAHERDPIVFESSGPAAVGSTTSTPEGDVAVTVAEVTETTSELVLDFSVRT
jgi:hypothetical protein